jgi:hypothetical protein
MSDQRGKVLSFGPFELSIGNLQATVRALIVAIEFLGTEMERQVSHGFCRGVKHGRFNTYVG